MPSVAVSVLSTLNRRTGLAVPIPTLPFSSTTRASELCAIAEAHRKTMPAKTDITIQARRGPFIANTSCPFQNSEESCIEPSYCCVDTQCASELASLSLDPLESATLLFKKMELDFLLGLAQRAIPKKISGRIGLSLLCSFRFIGNLCKLEEDWNPSP
jgi:hypothetical protein